LETFPHADLQLQEAHYLIKPGKLAGKKGVSLVSHYGW